MPPIASTLDELAPTRRAILLALRKRGEAGAEQLAEALGVTPSAVRQQLRALTAAGLVAHRDERPGPGRPRRRYRLDPAAEALFPRGYGELSTELLAYVEDEDPALLERVFERRRQARVEHARTRLAAHTSFAARTEELARILDEQGYLAEAEHLPDGTFRITEHNCAILAVAQRHGHACTSELGFLCEAMPDAEIRRVAHIASGSPACVYELRPR